MLTLVATAFIVALSACRDGAPPFEADARPPTSYGSPWRLTYSTGEDRAPVWSATGDTVVYTAEGFDHLPRSRGVVVALPRTGGPALPLFHGAQARSGIKRWLTAPAVAAGGGRLAYAEMLGIQHFPEACRIAGLPGVSWTCEGGHWTPSVPRVSHLVVRVRGADVAGAVPKDPGVHIRPSGVEPIEDPDLPPGFAEAEFVHVPPFQTEYRRSGTLFFRPSWAPDGERVVYSDGLRLRIWRPGADSGVIVPGTEHGISAAWSPDRDRLAFTRLEAADSSTVECRVSVGGFPSCVARQVVYEIARHVVTIIRPDGSGRVELTAGDEPAWAPDGRTIYFRRDGRIWRIGVDGDGLAPIEHTARGREPAVSPDGRFLAFARKDDRGDYDIWVVSLE